MMIPQTDSTTTSTAAPRHPKRRKTALKFIGAYAIAVLAAVFLFLSYRIYVHHQTFSSRTTFWLGDVHEDSDEVGFVMSPNRKGTSVLNHGIESPERRIPLRTDQFGFRIPMDREHTLVTPGGIASIGCSCTFGYGVAAESTFVYLAAEQIEVTPFNMGVCSYSAITSLGLLREHIQTLRPRDVVYGFGNFHLGRSIRPRSDGVLFQTYLTEESGSATRIKPLFDNKAAFTAVPGIEKQYYQPKLDGRKTPFSWKRFRVVLPLAWHDLKRLRQPEFLRLRFSTNDVQPDAYADELVDICRSAGARSTILFFPAFFGEQPMPELLRALEKYNGANDVLFVDSSGRLFSGIADQASYQLRYQVPRDGHPNRFMHLEMARALLDAYEAAGWLSRVSETGSRLE